MRIRAVRREAGIIAPVPFRNAPEPPIPLAVFFASLIRGVMPVQHGWLSLLANELGESLPAGYATHAGNSLLWPLNEQHVAWLKRTVTYGLVLIDTLGRPFLTRDRRSLLVPNGGDPPDVAGLAEFNDPRAFSIISR